ncbi:hypothetical protein WDU94_013094 [Cyamophila willieti]
MSSIGAGYDLSASQFSPDGRVFQVEYAQKAVENSSTAIGLKGKDGVVIAVEKLVLSKLYDPGANKRIFHIDNHIGMGISGLISDGRQLSETAKTEASEYRSKYGGDIPLHLLNEKVSMYVHAYTLYSMVRPFGASLLLASHDQKDGPSLYVVDPSGVSHGYFGCAIGKAKQNAKTEIEKLKLSTLSMEQLAKEAARIIYVVHDELKDKHFELELAWVGEKTNGKFELVPQSFLEECENYAKTSLQDSDSDNDL